MFLLAGTEMTTSQVQSQIPEYGQGNSDCSEESVNLVFVGDGALPYTYGFLSMYLICSMVHLVRL